MYCSRMALYSSCPAVSSTSKRATSSSIMHCLRYESKGSVIRNRAEGPVPYKNVHTFDSWIIFVDEMALDELDREARFPNTTPSDNNQFIFTEKLCLNAICQEQTLHYPYHLPDPCSKHASHLVQTPSSKNQLEFDRGNTNLRHLVETPSTREVKLLKKSVWYSRYTGGSIGDQAPARLLLLRDTLCEELGYCKRMVLVWECGKRGGRASIIVN